MKSIITKDEIRLKLKTNEKWLLRGLLSIYQFQTMEEQKSGYTKVINRVGFSGPDSEILSSFAEQYKRRGFLSPKQMAILKTKMPKYSGQLLKLAEHNLSK